VPNTLGPWKGTDSALDPLIARATGADQIVTRRYVNQTTGATVDLILIYGPAVEVRLHAPAVCYPAAGYAQVAGPEVRVIKAGGTEAPFKAMVFSKGEGGLSELQEVYYSWHYNGRWTPEDGKQKYFERIPSMYKVHLARRVVGGEKRDVGNPCESLLRELLPAMERQISGAKPPPA
jgi:EpsI family protein